MKKSTYFISYTTRTPNDIAWAKWLSWTIENKLNADTIIQEYDFHPGDNFKEHMHNALRSADAVVCVLTRAYQESANCTEEWTNALAGLKKIIPIRFDDCTPSGLLAARVYIDLYGFDKGSARERLIIKLKDSDRPTEEPNAPFVTVSSGNSEPDFPIASTSSSNTAKHKLPNRNKYFTGRENMLNEIYKGLLSDSVVSVVGAGGFGKTETSVEFAYRHASEYKLIWYFNAESEIQLQNDYREFAMRNMDLKNVTELEFDVVKKKIFDWLAENTLCLLIYDNAEGFTNTKQCASPNTEKHPNLKDYLPLMQNQNHILINSRERLRGIVAKKLFTMALSTEDSITFLQSRIPNTNKNDAEKLASTLGNLPLALECAASYIENRNYTLSGYLKLYEQNQIKSLKIRPNATEYHKTILTVWATTFDTLAKEAEKDEQMKASVQLFKLCAYCAPDGIPLELFVAGRDKVPQPLRGYLAPDDKLKHDDIIDNLVRYSITSVCRVDGQVLLSVHRLIQEVAIYDFEQKQNKNWVNYCLKIANSVLNSQYRTRKEFDEFSLNLPHVLEITRYSEEFLLADDSQKTIACIYAKSGSGLYAQGDYAKALEWYNKALRIREKV